jgi:hypothetical protein
MRVFSFALFAGCGPQFVLQPNTPSDPEDVEASDPTSGPTSDPTSEPDPEPPAEVEDDIWGTWSGTCEYAIPGDTVVYVLTLDLEDDGGTLSGVGVYDLEFASYGQVLSGSWTVVGERQGSTVSLDAENENGVSRFDLELRDDRMVGTLSSNIGGYYDFDCELAR